MRNVKLLLDRGRLTEEQLEQFSLVKRLLRQRCQTYLFNPQHANSITAGYTPSVEDILKRGIRQPNELPANRTLLEIERVRQEDKIKANAKNQEWQLKASELYHRELYKAIDIALTENPLKAIGVEIPDLVNVLYHPNVDFKKLSKLVQQSDALTDGIGRFVLREQNQGRLTKVDVKRQNMQTVLGQLGKDTIDELLPLLLIQQTTDTGMAIKRQSAEIKFRRLLSYNVNYVSQIIATLGDNTPYKRLTGIIGVLETLTYITVYRLFCIHQDEVRVRVMSKWRTQSQHSLHAAMQDVDINFNVLSIWMESFKEKVQEIIIQQLDWNYIRPVRRALEEHQERLPLHERSVLGVVLNHGFQFAQFKLLAEGKLASRSIITQYLYGSYIPNELSRLLLSSSMTTEPVQS